MRFWNFRTAVSAIQSNVRPDSYRREVREQARSLGHVVHGSFRRSDYNAWVELRFFQRIEATIQRNQYAASHSHTRLSVSLSSCYHNLALKSGLDWQIISAYLAIFLSVRSGWRGYNFRGRGDCVSEISGKPGQQSLRVTAFAVPALESMHGLGMAQTVTARTGIEIFRRFRKMSEKRSGVMSGVSLRRLDSSSDLHGLAPYFLQDLYAPWSR
jgi:hypothetical protein